MISQWLQVNETIKYEPPHHAAVHDSFEQTTKYRCPALSELADHECPICMCGFEETQDKSQKGIIMGRCSGHYFHLGCLDRKEMYKVCAFLFHCVAFYVCLRRHGTGVTRASHMRCFYRKEMLKVCPIFSPRCFLRRSESSQNGSDVTLGVC